MGSLDKQIEEINNYINDQVDQRVRDSIVAAKGANWAGTMEKLLRERNDLFAENLNLKEEIHKLSSKLEEKNSG